MDRLETIGHGNDGSVIMAFDVENHAMVIEALLCKGCLDVATGHSDTHDMALPSGHNPSALSPG
jgi:hypothetical protein